MSHQLGRVYTAAADTTCESLGLPTFENFSRLNRYELANGLSPFYNGAVAVAVRRTLNDDTMQVLTGIRRSQGGKGRENYKINETQPGVVSVATMIRAMDVVTACLDEDAVAAERRDAHTIIFHQPPRQFRKTRHCYVSHAAEAAAHIISAKLNMGDEVEDFIEDGAQFSCRNLLVGLSPVGGNGYNFETDTYSQEGIVMLNMAVYLTMEQSLRFPPESRELEQLTWVSEADFVRGFKDRQVNAFYGDKLGSAAVGVCVLGKCLEGTVLDIEEQDGK